MKGKTPDKYESRATVGTVELREHEGGGATITGMAALFDTLSENMGGFREIIAKGAFDETDFSDVRGLFNHDANFVLGRSVADTLRIKVTKRGLKYSIDAPNTQTIRDLVIEPIKRGDITQSSYGFVVGRGNDDWDENDDGVLIRTLRRINKVVDVSPAVFAAYSDTSVAVRSMEGFTDNRVSHDEVIEQHAKRVREFESRCRAALILGI